MCSVRPAKSIQRVPQQARSCGPEPRDVECCLIIMQAHLLDAVRDLVVGELCGIVRLMTSVSHPPIYAVWKDLSDLTVSFASVVVRDADRDKTLNHPGLIPLVYLCLLGSKGFGCHICMWSSNIIHDHKPQRTTYNCLHQHEAIN